MGMVLMVTMALRGLSLFIICFHTRRLLLGNDRVFAEEPKGGTVRCPRACYGTEISREKHNLGKLWFILKACGGTSMQDQIGIVTVHAWMLRRIEQHDHRYRDLS